MSVQKQTTREMIVEALHAASIIGLQDNADVARFIAGEGDIKMAALEMDSLGAMEFCINIELSCGVSIVPESLRQLDTLGELLAIVEGGF